MRYILIPVKDLRHAKQRLAKLMTQAERTRLAWVMLESTFAAAARTAKVDRIAVVTLYQPAIDLADKYGMEVIVEKEQISESASVDYGSIEAIRRGAESALRLPIDLPLIATEDIEAILDQEMPGNSVVIVPSRDATGTNAILRRPPDLFPSHFGPGSLARHLKEAERVNAGSKIMDLPRIALDIDDPADISLLLEQGRGSPAYNLLLEMGIVERLKGNRQD